MDLLKEIEKYTDEDSRPVSEQLSYIKKLGAMMMLSNRLYKSTTKRNYMILIKPIT